MVPDSDADYTIYNRNWSKRVFGNRRIGSLRPSMASSSNLPYIPLAASSRRRNS